MVVDNNKNHDNQCEGNRGESHNFCYTYRSLCEYFWRRPRYVRKRLVSTSRLITHLPSYTILTGPSSNYPRIQESRLNKNQLGLSHLTAQRCVQSHGLITCRLDGSHVMYLRNDQGRKN